jgi:hypothetical protein
MATKNAGAGRGFVNPQRTDEPDEEYVTPKDLYETEKERSEQETQRKTDMAAEEAGKGMKKGGKVKHKKMAKGGASRGDGCIERGHTRGHMR